MYLQTNDNQAHEIIHKETGKIIGAYPNYAEAYKVYEKLGWEATDYAIGIKCDLTFIKG